MKEWDGIVSASRDTIEPPTTMEEQLLDVQVWDTVRIGLPRRSSYSNRRIWGKAVMGIRKTWEGEAVLNYDGSRQTYLSVSKNTMWLLPEEYTYLKLRDKVK